MLIKTPDKDKGRSAPRNIMGVVMCEENGFYKLGILNVILVVDNVSSIFLSMRQLVAQEGNSKKGFVKCDYKKR